MALKKITLEEAEKLPLGFEMIEEMWGNFHSETEKMLRNHGWKGQRVVAKKNIKSSQKTNDLTSGNEAGFESK